MAGSKGKETRIDYHLWVREKECSLSPSPALAAAAKIIVTTESTTEMTTLNGADGSTDGTAGGSY